MNVCPAIVIVSVRSLLPCALTLYATVPLPVPLAPEVTVIHPALLLAVQAQPLAVVTATVPFPDPDKETLVGLIA